MKVVKQSVSVDQSQLERFQEFVDGAEQNLYAAQEYVSRLIKDDKWDYVIAAAANVDVLFMVYHRAQINRTSFENGRSIEWLLQGHKEDISFAKLQKKTVTSLEEKLHCASLIKASQAMIDFLRSL